MSREFCPAEGYAVWCRIEDLSLLCGYDPETQFDRLRELPEIYQRMSGLDPEEALHAECEERIRRVLDAEQNR